MDVWLAAFGKWLVCWLGVVGCPIVFRIMLVFLFGLVGWLVYCLVVCLVVCLVSCLTCWLAGWYVVFLISLLIV